MNELRLPQHFDYIVPIMEVLKEIGGPGRAGEVVDLVIEKLDIPEEELNVTNKNGQSRIVNQIHWARYLLMKADYIDSPRNGVWALTDKGMGAELTDQDLLDLYEYRKKIAKQLREAKAGLAAHTTVEKPEDDLVSSPHFLVQ